MALHDQRPPRAATGGGAATSLRDYVLSGCAAELAIERELSELERRMADGDGESSTLDRYARAQARLESHGGYLWRARATAMTRGLGFDEQALDRPLDTFSGGQLTRASLARALATGADVLLLDEPTNHLDIDSLEWLEQTLIGLDAAVMVVAHDRWFLEAVGTAVLELHGSPTRTRFFAGSWAAWRKEQAARELALGRSIERQQAEIERMERFVERFRYKATKARQANPGSRSWPRWSGSAGPTRGPHPRLPIQGPRAFGTRDLRAARRPDRGGRRAGRAAEHSRAVARAR